MDGTERLRQHIEEKTKARISALLSDAEQQKQAFIMQAQEEAARIEQEAETKYRAKLEEQKRRQKSMRQLDARREELRMKQDLLQQTLVKVEESLHNSDPEKRKALYLRWLDSARTSMEEIEISKNDQAWFEGVLRETYPELVEIHVREDFDGGFILKKGRTIQDFRFTEILKQNEQEFLEIAARTLFPVEERGEQ